MKLTRLFLLICVVLTFACGTAMASLTIPTETKTECGYYIGTDTSYGPDHTQVITHNLDYMPSYIMIYPVNYSDSMVPIMVFPRLYSPTSSPYLDYPDSYNEPQIIRFGDYPSKSAVDGSVTDVNEYSFTVCNSYSNNNCWYNRSGITYFYIMVACDTYPNIDNL